MYAVAMTLAGDDNRRHMELLCRAEGMVASLRAVGWADDVVCLVHGKIAVDARLKPLCSHVYAPEYLPAYDSGPPDSNTSRTTEWYREHERAPPPAWSHLQARNDGPETSLKFFAWALTRYRLVLHTDADVHFLESPAAALAEAHGRGLLFQAARVERGKRGYLGLNTHMMILRPSLSIFAVLAANAATGHFIPYTRTEQDVIESTLPHVSLGLAAGGANLTSLVHLQGSRFFGSPEVRHERNPYGQACTATDVPYAETDIPSRPLPPPIGGVRASCRRSMPPTFPRVTHRTRSVQALFTYSSPGLHAYPRRSACRRTCTTSRMGAARGTAAARHRTRGSGRTYHAAPAPPQRPT
jgi:hypothetical protein